MSKKNEEVIVIVIVFFFNLFFFNFTIFKNHEQRKKNFDGDTIHK